MASLNPIACQPCRSKKCKCDRKLPICSQCQSSPVSCRYQEGGKRGLPAAYMNSLEMRLHETETALHAALLTLQDLGSIESLDLNSFSSESRSKRMRSKGEKQDEWRQMPLKTNDNLVSWLQHMSQDHDPDHWRSAQHISDVASPPIPPTDLGQPQASKHHQPSNDFTAILQKLRICDPPICPNAFGENYALHWHDNYF